MTANASATELLPLLSSWPLASLLALVVSVAATLYLQRNPVADCALRSKYDNGRHVENSKAIFNGWKEESLQMQKKWGRRRIVQQYGTGKNEKWDLYPAKDPLKPCCIHLRALILAFPALFLALKSVETETVKKLELHFCGDNREK